MDHRQRLRKSVLCLASVILVITALLHGAGYAPLLAKMKEIALEPAWAAGIKALWLIFSAHLVILAMLLLTAAVKPASMDRRIVAICGLIPAADTILLLSTVGVFVGSVFLGITTLLVFIPLAAEPASPQQ